MNIIGISKKINIKKLEQLINIKFYHYLNMTNYCNNSTLIYNKKIFEQKLKYMRKIKVKFKNQKFRKELLNEINKKKYNLFNGWFNELSINN